MALTLQQIVDMADSRVPNTQSNSDKVAFLDQLQRKLYRIFRFPNEIEKLETVADQAFYTLPDYIQLPRIKNVVVTDSDGSNPREYEYRGHDETLKYYCYFTFETPDERMIGLYPEPSETGRLILITFEDGPNTFSSTDMTTVPRFFKDYHMLFVYGLCAELAKIQNDVVLANNYQRDYDELLREAISKINYGRPMKTKNVRPFIRTNRRKTVEVIVQSG